MKSLPEALAEMERHLIVTALALHGDCRARAADNLGISRVALYKKMKKYGLIQNPKGRLHQPRRKKLPPLPEKARGA